MAAAGKFLLGLAVFFSVISFALWLIPLKAVELFFAAPVLEALKLFGFSGSIDAANEPVRIILDASAIPIAISYLCTGLMEIAIIASAVLASFGISLQKRIVGVAAGILAIIIFNFIRILASVLIILWFGLDIGGFSHDLLFRIFLFIVIAGFYFAWMKWAEK